MGGDVDCQFQAAPDSEFVKGVAQIVLHNLFSSANCPRNIAVGHSLPDQPGKEQDPEVLFCGVWADIELGCDLFVATALDKQLEHLLTARSDFDVVKV